VASGACRRRSIATLCVTTGVSIPTVELIEPNTERLRLRQWNSADRDAFAGLNADPRVMEFFPAPLNRVESDAIAARCESLIQERAWGLWAVELKSSRDFIGFIGLHTPSPELPFAPCVEIGWRLAFHYWGKGLAFEGAKAAIRVGFELLNLPEIVSFTSVENRRSRALMERLGMLKSGQFDHPHLPQGNNLRPHCLYRLARENDDG
jgi:RimJ/RimL family protein N-acetyltransferase